MNSRIVAILEFLFIAAAAISYLLTPIPESPTNGIYISWWVSWMFLGFAASLLLYELLWAVVPTHRLLFTLSLIILQIVQFSLSWRVPFGSHDVWVHYETLRIRDLSFATNPYPSYNALLITLVEVTGFPEQTVLAGMPIIAGLLGLLGLTMATRTLPFDRRLVKAGVVIGLPAVFIQITPRPIGLAYLFLMFAIWVLSRQTFSLSRFQATSLAICFTVGVLPLHPQALVFIGMFSGLVAAVYYSSKQDPPWVSLPEYHRIVGVFPFVTLIAFTTYFLQLGASRQVLLMLAGFTGVSPSAPDSAAGEGLFSQIMNNPELVSEALLRIGFPLMLGLVSSIGLLVLVRKRSIEPYSLEPVLYTGFLGAVFIIVDIVFKSSLINANRLLLLVAAPLILSALYGIQAIEHRVGHQAMLSISLAILAVGGLGLYGSPITGGISQSATEKQVAGINWLDNYNEDRSVAGSDMTFWITQGIAGVDRIYDWTPNDGVANPKLGVGLRGTPPWIDALEGESGLVVSDHTARGIAQVEANESGNRSELHRLEEFSHRADRVYSNGGTRIYDVKNGTNQVYND